MSKKSLALLLSLVMGVAFTSVGILGCGSDDKPSPRRFVPAEIDVEVDSTRILGLLAGKCFVFPDASFLSNQVAGEVVTVCYETELDGQGRLGVTMTIDAAREASGFEMLGSLILDVEESTIPGLGPDEYDVLQVIKLRSEGGISRDEQGYATKAITIDSGLSGESNEIEFCELTCSREGNLNCDGVRVGMCETVTGVTGVGGP